MKILMLEDDQRLRSVVVRGLHRSGHTVDVAQTIAEARWHIAETSHDVLILDVMLPDGDGFGLCRDLRSQGNWSPVLMLTARDAVADRVRGLDVGADDYLVKPFAFAELEARLRALDRRGPSTRPTTLVVGALELDPSSHRATLGSRQLDLTGRQFALLEFFARRADQVLSRSQILDQVWDWAFDGDPRIIDVYVRLLRQQLGPDLGSPWIETIRGVGYALRPERSDGPA
ncbi:MAG: response regulator transcription factor [Chloroflexota bacterium]|nr:MAG: response regulator transcription factor [Chloroflexota bacterium]